MPIDDTPITASSSDPLAGACVCGSTGCGGQCLTGQTVATGPITPVFATDQAVCSCALQDPIAAAYEASRLGDMDGLIGLEANTILSSAVNGPLMLNDATQAPIPGGMQFYLQFQLNWQGDDREEFQVLAKVATAQSASTNQIELKQVFGSTQVQLLVEVNGVEKSFVVNGVMVNSDRNWIVQVTDQGQAQLIIDGALRGEMFVGDISSIPRDQVTLGKSDFGGGNQVWGAFSNVRADLDGDGLQDVVQVPPPRLPVPFAPDPIPDLPNPNPDGFTNTALIPNADRIITRGDTGNPIIDTMSVGVGWKGDTITYSFNVQDIDNNGKADFDEGGWRKFYAHMLTNVTQFTGVDFWERPEGVGTIEYNLAPGGGGVSGTPGLFAAPNTGTIVGITGAVADVGLNVGAFNFTRTFFHETGHALGLAHPHDFENPNGIDTGISQGFAGISQKGDHFLNSKLYASTSYAGKFWGEDNPFTTAVDFGTNLDGLDQSTFLPFDIAALQTLYGINPTFALGDDVYSFNDSGAESQGLRTIWDNGGTDTIQYTGSQRSVINLNDATIRQEVGGGGFLSTSESLDAGFLIANGVTIENAIGGEKQDFITGNEVANTLTGNGGNDIIKGGDGNDVLIGGTGNDSLDGGSDMDVASLSGARADYSWNGQADNIWTFTHLTTGAVDTLRDIETVRFEASNETLVLSATPFTARPLEVTQPPPIIPGPAFFAEATVRFDNPAGGQWQRVFDFGNGPAKQNILLTQVRNTNTMRLDYYGETSNFYLEVPNSIVQGRVATWRVEISELGAVKIFKDGVVVATGTGQPLLDVPRANLLVGQSNWSGDTPLIGEVLSFTADINGDGTIDVQRGTADPLPGIVNGTVGDDFLSVGFADVQDDAVDGPDGLNDVIDVGGGNDTVSFGAGSNTVYGGAGDDLINSGIVSGAASGNTLIYGGIGNDNISDSAGNDTVYGGLGNDLLTLDRGGDDVADGGDGNDTLIGGAGNDTLTVGAGDTARGGDGDDTFIVDVTQLDANGQTVANNTVDGRSSAPDNDVLDLRNAGNWRILTQAADASGSGTSGAIQFLGASGVATGRVLNFTGIESILGTAFAPPNQPPAFTNLTDGQTISIPENTTFVVDANASDPDSDSLTFSIAGGADAARFTINPATGVLAFASAVDFEGTRSAVGNDQIYEITIRATDVWGSQRDVAVLVNVTDVFEVPPDGTVNGSAGNDTLTAGFADAQTDQIDGTDGLNDSINAGAGNDSVDAGQGNDTVFGDTGTDSLFGNVGNDSLIGDAGNDTLDGGAGADSLYGGTDNDSVFNGLGRDLVYGGAGDDRLIDTSGYNSTSDADTVYGDAGNDTIEGTTSDDQLFGGADNDRLIGEAGNDLLDGGLGEDALQGEDGNDTVSGGDGNDTLWGAAGTDALDGGAGNDSLNGGLGNDTLGGGAGNDNLSGGDNDDRFTLTADFGRDTIVGGETLETIGDSLSATDVVAATTLTFTAAEAGTITDGTSTATFSQIENFALGSGNDSALGGAGNDRIDAGAGSDSLSGGAGNDSLSGGADNDTLTGGTGSDSLIGGEGRDSLAGGDGDDDIVIGASDQAFGDSGDDVFSINPALAGTGTILVQGGETGEEAAIDGANNPGGLSGDVLDLTGGSNVRLVYDRSDPTWNGTTSESGTATYRNSLNQNVTVQFSQIERVVACFAAGAMIETARGERAIESLQVGDLVRTADHDYQPIRWIGSSKVAATGSVAPILIKAGALGNTRDLKVSPQHRMLLGGWQAEMLFGGDEVLVAAKHLVNDQTILRLEGGEVHYFHMLFDAHEIVFANGTPSESFHPGQIGWTALAEEARAEILELFPELAMGDFTAYGASARRSLTAFEAKIVAEMIAP